MSIIAPRKKSPDQNHGGARCYSEEDTTCKVTAPQRDFPHLIAVDLDDFTDAISGADGQVKPERHPDEVNGIGTNEGIE